jgi:hypothetical protein
VPIPGISLLVQFFYLGLVPIYRPNI